MIVRVEGPAGKACWGVKEVWVGVNELSAVWKGVGLEDAQATGPLPGIALEPAADDDERARSRSPDDRPSTWRRVASFTSGAHRTDDQVDLRNGRSWSLRLKKSSRADKKHRKSQDEASLSIEENASTAESVVVTAAPGTTAVLRCQLEAGASPPIAATWHLLDGSWVRASRLDDSRNVLFRMGASQEFEPPTGCAPSRSLADRFVARLRADGSSTLEVANCGLPDAGIYACCFYTDGAKAAVVSARLIVTGSPSEPGRPNLVYARGTKLHFKWEAAHESDGAPMAGYVLEKTVNGLECWEPAGPPTAFCSQVIHCDPGCFVFRVVSYSELGMNNPGPPSEAITVTGNALVSDSGVVEWKRKNFPEDFVAVAECGRGRFSMVKKYIHRESGERVAAKIIHSMQQSRASVEHECLILNGLDYQGLVQPLDCYITPINYILIFPFIDGLRLLDHICMQGSFYSEHTVSHYLSQLLAALDYLHLSGIAHLDIKPENLLVEECSDVLKLIDFGDARKVLGAECRMSIVGTTEFMAPEMLMGNPLATRTDLWGTGAVLYLLLVGRSPFFGRSEEETSAKIKAAEYAFPASASISARARDLISKLLVVDSHKRPSASKALADPWIKEAPKAQRLSSCLLQKFVKRRDRML
ncbi:kalirin-like [Haemaphysalis longicornis]